MDIRIMCIVCTHECQLAHIGQGHLNIHVKSSYASICASQGPEEDTNTVGRTTARGARQEAK